MVEILFKLFIWNSNGELRRTTTISSLSRNSKIDVILIVSEQQICIWMHNYYSYSENNNYSVIHGPSKHILSITSIILIKIKLIIN
jgi:2-C-methyl-D-erythritol 4-phosphate cytidylyltransferase